MGYLTSPPLKMGDTIGLITPSSPMMLGRLEAIVAYLEKRGFEVKQGKHLHNAERFLAGRDIDRADDIMRFFIDPDIKAIMATGGGYGSQRILPLLDYEAIRANPKMVIGFSDTTALQLGLLKKAGVVSCTGFIFPQTAQDVSEPLNDETLMACLKGESYQIVGGKTAQSGIAEGPLIGGNLEALIALMGTPFQPDFKNSILLIEGVGAEPYQIDAQLSQLALAGVYKQVAGIVFGKFERCLAEYFPERDGTVNDVIQEWSSSCKAPCITDFPYGHFDKRRVLPIGKQVVLNADETTLIIR